MTALEFVQDLIEEGVKSTDPIDRLIDKIARVADRSGIDVPDLELAEHDAFSAEELQLCTAGIVEQAARLQHQRHERKLTREFDAMLTILPKREDGWYLDNRDQGDESMPEFGPYATKKEAQEARSSILRSRRMKLRDVVSCPEDRAKARAFAKAAAKIDLSRVDPRDQEEAAELPPTAAKPLESEAVMTTKAKAKPAKAAKQAKAKPTGRKPGAKPVWLSDCAAAVLRGRKHPMSVAEIYAAIVERGLWKPSPTSKTPVATLSAKLYLEIQRKGKEARFRLAGKGLFLPNQG
jgi:hypothetical protein